MNQETPQTRKTKRKIVSQESDGIMQKALKVLNETEDQYDVFGRYIKATELRNLPSEYLRKKLKRKFQQAILEISEEDERLSAVTSAYSNPGSVGSYTGNTADTSAYNNTSSTSSYSYHTDLSNPPVLVSQQPLLTSVSQYLRTETESSYENI